MTFSMNQPVSVSTGVADMQQWNSEQGPSSSVSEVKEGFSQQADALGS